MSKGDKRMKRMLVLVLMGAMAAAAVAAETQAPAAKAPAKPVATVSDNPVVFDLDATYVTKYIWRGFDVLDDKAAFQPSANMAYEGINLNVWSSFAGASKNDGSHSTVDATEMDYTVSYKNVIEADNLTTNYTVGWRYYDYIKLNSEASDMQEGFIELAWPDLIGNGFTPRYAYYHMWAARSSKGAQGFNEGPIHDLGLDYLWVCDCIPELPLKFSADAIYNDGTGTSIDNKANAHQADHDWSHILWGVSTNFRCPLTNAKVTPALYYQTSMDDSVNKNDELFGGISYTLTF